MYGRVSFMERLKKFCKSEIVLVISFVLAVISSFIVKPSAEYIDYIDFRTLALLFCLMAVMAGLNGLGVFKMMAEKLLKMVSTVRGLSVVLCMLCFFSSMIITNDVALITFVPFTIVTLKMSGKMEKLIPLVTIETVAANLGSMLTPIGNPQNLYLFSTFEMTMGDFLTTIMPYALLSLVMTVLFAAFIGHEKIETPAAEKEKDINARQCIIYIVLFAISLLTVFRVVPYLITLAVTVIAVLVFDRNTIKKIDYSLLLTFIFLFVFIGNLGNIAPVSEFLRSIVTDNEVVVGVLSSQVFSNVPAALLLSGFTQNAKALLIGVNLGGLGTLIASMASLISFKLIAKEKINTGKYIGVFTVVNIVFLAANMLLWVCIR